MKTSAVRAWILAPLFFALLPPPATGQQIGANAAQQIAALLAEKAGRTPAQRKISSSLLFEIKKARRDPMLKSLPELRSGVAVDRGQTLVDLDAGVSDALLARIEELGGEVVSHFERYDAVRARLPLAAIEPLAGEPKVRNVRPADAFMLQGNTTITEGDEAHQADLARANLGVDGTGVTACAMSDSVDELATLIAAGELPVGTAALAGQDGGAGSSEGTALLEIMHDLAPGAALLFATGAGGPAQMATNIEDLATAGCDVINDDVFYFAEGVFQDDVIAQAVETVAAQGVLYFSSAGNSGNLNDGESGVWEGDFAGTALPAPIAPFVSAGATAHDFAGGDVFNTVTEDPLNDARFFTLHWSDPLGGSGNDYDLFLLDPAGTTVLAGSTDVQDGDDDPFEDISSDGFDDSGNVLAVVQNSGAAGRFLHLNTNRGRLEHGTDGQIAGHAAAASAFAVAAVRVPAGGGAFDGSEEVETFSSDGPRRIFFDAGGSPVARGPAGRGIAQTSVVRHKPDVAAADGVMTTSSNFTTFFGTSASVPHAAGISALWRELVPALKTPQIRDIFLSSALDIEDPGFDRDSGAGILDADFDPAPIFTDGFESGNTSVWSSSVP